MYFISIVKLKLLTFANQVEISADNLQNGSKILPPRNLLNPLNHIKLSTQNTLIFNILWYEIICYTVVYANMILKMGMTNPELQFVISRSENGHASE